MHLLQCVMGIYPLLYNNGKNFRKTQIVHIVRYVYNVGFMWSYFNVHPKLSKVGVGVSLYYMPIDRVMVLGIDYKFSLKGILLIYHHQR